MTSFMRFLVNSYQAAIIGGVTASAVLFVILIFTTMFAAIGISIYGLVITFMSSVILGIIVLLIRPDQFPIFFIFGICNLFGKNIPEAIQNWIKFPF
jgi:hypothetical protein